MNTAQDFAYWLQGFVELQDSDSISDKQWLAIKDHLKLVFDKKTPDRNTMINTEIKLGGPAVDWTEVMKKYQTMHPYTITC